MKTLFIDACAREGSRTRSLAQYALGKLSGDIETAHLYDLPIAPADEPGLLRRDALVRAGELEHPLFAPARQLTSADRLLIAAPYWDLLCPAILKVYIESVMINGLVFFYAEDGTICTRCRAKELIYISTAGGAVPGAQLGYTYASLVGRTFWGIEKTKLFQAERLDIIGENPEEILADCRRDIDKYFSLQER